MNEVKYVRERTQNTCCDLQLFIETKAFFMAINHWNVKEQGIQRDSNHTREYKYLVPLLKEQALWIKSSVARSEAFRQKAS